MNKERKPMANIPPFGLRMQPELKARVEEAARANNRSLNAEIVQILEEKFPEPLDLAQRLNHIVNLFSALRKVAGHEDAINSLTELLLDTIEGIASGRVESVDIDTQNRVKEHLDHWYSEVQAVAKHN